MTAPNTASPNRTLRAAQLRPLLLALTLTWTLAGCGDYGGGSSGTSSSSAALPPTGSGGALPDPAQSIPAFETHVLPILQARCASCHSGAGPGSPAIAHADTNTAYFATVNNQKVNLGNPIASRLVQRLAVDLHYCWGVCTDNAEVLRAAIAAWATDVDFSGGTVDPGTIRSASQTFDDGQELDSNEERYSLNRIAYWEFKEGEPSLTAADTSGVAPAMDLTLEGGDVSWLTSYGIDIADGRAIAGATESRKLYDQIADPATGSQQYSIEAWIVPANIDQGDDTPRIVSYSQSTGRRNFTLGQVFYQYSFRNRNVSSEVNLNGRPTLLTYDMDRDAQATLQHVVITYDQSNGRRVYVDGGWTDDMDEQLAQPLWNWDPSYTFVLGNELSNDRQWMGKVQLVAIYRQALTPAQINQNYLAGVGRKVVLRFDMSAWAGPGAYLEFLVSELDSSYLFCSPVFYAGSANGLRLAGIRIAVNGLIPVNGQAFTNIDAASFGAPTQVSRLCSIVAQQNGAGLDAFEIDLEIVDGFQHDFVDTVTPFPTDNSVNAPVPVEGVRDFERLSASMAAITGVSAGDPAVRALYESLQQQLPAGVDMRTFVSSNQMAITKLALEYCDVMVEDPGLRDDFFGPASPFPFDSDVATAFAGANADLIVDPLVSKVLGTAIPNQPDPAIVTAELHDLITSLNTTCTLCDAQRTRDTVKATCTGVLGSAAVTLH